MEPVRRVGAARFAPASLTVRLTATVVLLVALVGLLVSALTTVVMREHLMGQLDQEVEEAHVRALMPLRAGLPLGVPDERGPIRDLRGQSTGTVTAYLADGGAAGTVQTISGATLSLSGDELAALAELPTDARLRTRDLPGLGDYRLLVSGVRDIEGITVVAGIPTDRVDETLGELIGWGVGLTALGVAMAGGLAVVVVRRQLRPLRSVARTAHEVAALPLSSGAVGRTARVPDALTDESTEVGQVGSALNTLLGHMETSLDARHRSEQQVRQFVADASHELRTPLATIQGYAELGLRPSTPAAEIEHVLGKVQAESHRMAALVEDLLLLARLDAGRPLAREVVDLSRLVLEAVSAARVVAPAHQWRIDLPDEAVEVPGDAARLRQVLDNLLANARRHTPDATTVTVAVRAVRAVRAVGSHVELTVHDDGPGVPADLQAEVFDRFTRGDASRTRDSGGAGLGLSLARAIAEAHAGTLTLVSVPGATTFTLTLPA